MQRQFDFSLNSYHQIIITQCNNERKPAVPDPPTAPFRSSGPRKRSRGPKGADPGRPTASAGGVSGRSRSLSRRLPTPVQSSPPARRLPERLLILHTPTPSTRGGLEKRGRFPRSLLRGKKKPTNPHLPSKARPRGEARAPGPARQHERYRGSGLSLNRFSSFLNTQRTAARGKAESSRPPAWGHGQSSRSDRAKLLLLLLLLLSWANSPSRPHLDG